jgi:nitrile hydratase beta subunit
VTYQSRADLGGRPDSRAVLPEAEGELFHAPWEPRVLSLTLAMGATGLWNIDMSRSARETLENYSELSYYEIWLAGLQKLLLDSGATSADEISSGRMTRPAIKVARVLSADAVAGVLAAGAPVSRVAGRPARFTVGQAVRTRADTPPHHTRLPGYARGKQGTIERVHGAHVFADSNAQAQGEQPQWLYTVVFDAADLWSPSPPGAAPTRVSIDAWESYLAPA